MNSNYSDNNIIKQNSKTGNEFDDHKKVLSSNESEISFHDDSNSSLSHIHLTMTTPEDHRLSLESNDSYENEGASGSDTFPNPHSSVTSRRSLPANLRSMHKEENNSTEHKSFRHRVKKEDRSSSFTYKQVSDESSPTEHRKQLFSKRSYCKLTNIAKEEVSGGKHVAVNKYYFLKTLGKGAYGEVRLATKEFLEEDAFDEQINSRYAIKVMQRSMFEGRKSLPSRGRQLKPATDQKSGTSSIEDANIPSALLQEINIMKRLVHPNLVNLSEIINDENSKYLFLVMEFMDGGTIMTLDNKLGKYVHGLTKTVMLEATARRAFKELTSALSYLHANHIAHRDIKPDNLLIDLKGRLKLSDFGVSTHFENDRKKNSISMKSLARSTSRGQMKKTEGTYSFYSPEMCVTGVKEAGSKGYNAYMADIWAAGVCLWIFVFGFVPFQSSDVTELFRMIREDQPRRLHRLSPELDNLLGLMFRKDVSRRPSCMDVRHHCWVTETPLSQHAEVFLNDSKVETLKPATLSPTSSSSSTRATSLTTSLSSHPNRNSHTAGEVIGEIQDNMDNGSDGVELSASVKTKLLAWHSSVTVSPTIRIKLLAWLASARETCESRNRTIIAKNRSEINILIRKAKHKTKGFSIKEEEEGSDDDSEADGSRKSFGFSSSSSESGEATLVNMSREDCSSTVSDPLGQFSSSDFSDDNLDTEKDVDMSSDKSSNKSNSNSDERNIFQRGLHIVERRILSLTSNDSRSRDGFPREGIEEDEDGMSEENREGNERGKRHSDRNILQRGIHKVEKRINSLKSNDPKSGEGFPREENDKENDELSEEGTEGSERGKRSSDRNIFQRGLHKVTKRILRKSVSK